MSRLPIRVRLTLAFALTAGAVLAGAGFLLFHHLAASLDQTLDQSLHARAADVAALVKQADTGLRTAPSTPAGGEASFAQVLDSRGRVFDETRGLGGQPLIGGRLLAKARTAPVLVPRVHRPGGDVRLFALPVHAQDQQLVIVVGAPLASHDQALATLRGELLVGGPIALALASLIGYFVAAAALRPVERMRTRASSISERHLSERLPIPPARDEIARLGETLNTMLARIEHGVARERSFVADASHELRSPLALLRTEVELALDLPRDADELRAALRSIGEEADRLSQLAEDLLLLARLDEGQLPLRREQIDAEVLLHDAATRFTRRAEDANRTIAVDATGVQILGDRLRLEQAIGNLIENALRHGAGTITLTALERTDHTEIHVTDEGKGLPPAFADSAFERFTRADPSRTGAGAGLGLAIVKAIAEAHGGTATSTPESTAGADICLILPSADDVNSSHTVEAEATRPQPPTWSAPRRSTSPTVRATAAGNAGSTVARSRRG